MPKLACYHKLASVLEAAHCYPQPGANQKSRSYFVGEPIAPAVPVLSAPACDLDVV
jgi:hypothetical protein